MNINRKNIIATVMSFALIAPTLVSPLGANAQTIKNRPPVIQGISSPTVLQVDKTGTWSIDAYDPEGGNLSYSVDWGEINLLKILSSSSSFVQTATFEHSYATAGIHNVKVTVRDEQGLTSKASVTIRVTESDVDQLTINNASATGTKPNKAVINWDTNFRSNTSVWYSTSSPVDTSRDPDIFRPNSVTKHKVTLTKLQPGTKYYAIVKSVSAKNGSAVSEEISWKTPPLPNQAPVIVGISGPNDLVVDEEGEWTLNAYDPHDGQLSYSVDWGDSNSARLMDTSMMNKPFVQTSTFSHSYAGAGTYTIVFSVKNETGIVTTGTATVEIHEEEDTTPPVIDDIVTESIGSSEATVTWDTDEDSDSSIWISTGSSVDTTIPPVVYSSLLTTSHSLVLTGLTASTTYLVSVGSADVDGNISTSSPFSLTTLGI